MDSATPVLYACTLFFCISFLTVVVYIADLQRIARAMTVRELDCSPALTMERETVRYQLHQRLHADTADALKRTVTGLGVVTLLGAAFLSYRYHVAGVSLAVPCAALAVAAFVLMIATSATFGAKNEAKLAKSAQLAAYAADVTRLAGLFDQLKATRLLNQAARNAESLKGTGVISGDSAPVFDIFLYQLEMRLIERIQNIHRMRSRAEAETYLRAQTTDGATLLQYIRFNKDADTPLLTEILRVYDDNDQTTTAADPATISREKTNANSAIVHILENAEDTKKDDKKVNYTAADLAELRAAIVRLSTTTYAPYVAEIDARLAGITRTLYVLLVILAYFAFKWAIYRTSELIVTGAVAIFVAAYVLYYTYFG